MLFLSRKIQRMNAQNISVAEILNCSENLEEKNFETLYKGMVSLHVIRNGKQQLNAVEAELINKINTGFDEKKWERLKYLDWKLEFGALSSKEESESLKLAEAYEQFSVERLKALSQLALLRKIHIDTLMEQMGINLKVHD